MVLLSEAVKITHGIGSLYCVHFAPDSENILARGKTGTTHVTRHVLIPVNGRLATGIYEVLL
jgi:hypothetical protein